VATRPGKHHHSLIVARDFPTDVRRVTWHSDSPGDCTGTVSLCAEPALEHFGGAFCGWHILCPSEKSSHSSSLEPEGSRKEKPMLHIRTLRLPSPGLDSKLVLKLLQLISSHQCLPPCPCVAFAPELPSQSALAARGLEFLRARSSSDPDLLKAEPFEKAKPRDWERDMCVPVLHTRRAELRFGRPTWAARAIKDKPRNSESLSTAGHAGFFRPPRLQRLSPSRSKQRSFPATRRRPFAADTRFLGPEEKRNLVVLELPGPARNGIRHWTCVQSEAEHAQKAERDALYRPFKEAEQRTARILVEHAHALTFCSSASRPYR